MHDRFTKKTRTERGRIRKRIRQDVCERDAQTCQFCGRLLGEGQFTIDHVIPLANGGTDEVTNYVTSCLECNQRKADLPLAEFAKTINIKIEELPVHGDPVIDNERLPIELRLLRKRIFDRIREGELRAGGTSAQKKVEKLYRRTFWQTPEGKALEAEFPQLPGPVRVMVPEIRAIAANAKDFLLLLELAKSANTRNLIGTLVTSDCDVEERVRSIQAKSGDPSLRKRVGWALERWQTETEKRGL